MMAEHILFPVLNQPQNLPIDCVCSHIRLFERFILNAGRRLVDLTQVLFGDILRAAAINCQRPSLAPAIRLELANIVAGCLKFTSNDLFQARPSILTALYGKTFDKHSIEKGLQGVDVQIAQILAFHFPEFCLSIREFPNQLLKLCTTIIPNFCAIFLQMKNNDASYLVALHFALTKIPQIFEIENNKGYMEKLWQAIYKMLEDFASRSKGTHQLTSSHHHHHQRRNDVKKVKNNLEHWILELYLALAYFRVKHGMDCGDSFPDIQTVNNYPQIAVKWVQSHPMDIPNALMVEWWNWSIGILSKPSKLCMDHLFFIFDDSNQVNFPLL